MKKKILYTLLGGILCVGQTPAVYAASDPAEPAHILIAEIQTGGASDATEEFVELYNPNDTATDVTGWLLQYRAASGTATQTWPASSTKATFACPATSPASCRVLIPARNRIVFTHTIANVAEALPMNGGFSGSGGQIRLVEPTVTPIVHDLVGYGTAAHAETDPATAPVGGKSIKRIVGIDDSPVDTDNNRQDFMAACGGPTPGQADTSYIPTPDGCQEPSTPDPLPETTDSDSNPQPDPLTDAPDATPSELSTTPPTPTYLPVLITEVFADPKSPQQDTTDEFIELYNPNDSAITLTDYRLQTGSDYRYTYTLGDTPLGPRMYLAIPSAVSKLSLANTGSGVRLMDPNGTVASEAPTYGDAKEGQAWMQDDTGWKWTLTPTPGSANALSVPPPKIVATTAPSPTKKKNVTKVTAAKSSAPKQTKAPPAKKTTAEEKPKPPAAQAAHVAANPQYWLLVPLGTLAAGYAAYEYRHGIRRAVHDRWAKMRGKDLSCK